MRIVFLLLLFKLVILGADYAGTIKSMRGDVFVVRNFETLEASRGYKLLSKDIVITAARSKAKLKFKDGTLISLGKNSIFEIENYMFDKTKKSKAKFRAKYGFFSAVTGKIGKVAPKSFALKTKTATIGVRGTAFKGSITKKGEEVECTKGTITVSAKGKTFVVNAGEKLEINKRMFEPDLDVMGEIVSITGTVFLINKGKTFLATVGQQIRPDDKIVAGYNSMANILLVDKTDITVYKNSGILIDYKNGLDVIKVLKGAVKVKGRSKANIFAQGDAVKMLNGRFKD
jgi:hypothetical protein